MKKITFKMLTGICLIVIIILINYTYVYGALPIKVNENNPGNTQELVKTSEKVLGAIQVIGIVLSVGILMVLGIKYMMGSAEEKAEYKKTMIPYLVGAILLFAATTIAEAIYQMAIKV